MNVSLLFEETLVKNIFGFVKIKTNKIPVTLFVPIERCPKEVRKGNASPIVCVTKELNLLALQDD